MNDLSANKPERPDLTWVVQGRSDHDEKWKDLSWCTTKSQATGRLADLYGERLYEDLQIVRRYVV